VDAITRFLQNAVASLQTWLGVAAAVFLLFAAVELFTAGDNPAQRSHAWRRLLSVAIGLGIILFAKNIVATLYGWAGVPAPF
jgi:type IV secretory pathway VirB2 component (pilin)